MAHEETHRHLMRLHATSGRRDDALRQYRDCARALAAELGIEPSRETVDLHAAIQHGRFVTISDRSSAEKVVMEAGPGPEAILDRPTIAVRPFTNLSEESGQDYFADGITEDLIALVAGWRWFPVLTPGSTFAYRDRRRGLGRIAQELGACYLVTGAVRRRRSGGAASAEILEG